MLRDFLTIMRPGNCIVAAIGCFIGFSVSNYAIEFSLPLLYAMIAVFFVCAGGQAINDYFDRNIDKKLHPDKPIPSGRVPSKTAYMYALVLFLLGFLSAYYVNQTAFYIALLFALLLFSYSAFLPKYKYIGNFVVAFGTGFTLIYGATLTGNYFVVSLLAAAAIFANVAREIIKDLEDAEADKGYKKSLPHIIPKKYVLIFILLYYVLAIFLSYVPAIFSIYNPLLKGFISLPYLSVISVANFIFLFSFNLSILKRLDKAQKFSKIGMAIALFAFLLAVFF